MKIISNEKGGYQKTFTFFLVLIMAFPLAFPIYDVAANSFAVLPDMQAFEAPSELDYNPDDIGVAMASTVNDFSTTEWKTEALSDANSEIANNTLDWSNIEKKDSSDTVLSTASKVELFDAMYTWADSTLFDDDCSSTSGWTAQSSWSGQLPISELQTGISLLINNGRFESGSIPSSSTYLHGPMWTKALSRTAQVGEGLDLSVVLQHEYVSLKMGDAGVVVYDIDDKIIFRVCVHDGWYATKTTAYVVYYSATGTGYSQSVSRYSSWSGTLRVWYDIEDDAIKATVLGGSYTLVPNPSDADLSRVANNVAIYFAGKSGYAYDSKFIDSISVTADSSSNTAIPASLASPAMEGHWFPQVSYSKLYFQVKQPNYADPYFALRIRIESDQDTIDRIFTVIVDDVIHYQDTIRVGTGFDGVVNVFGSGIRKVILQINYGAYTAKGWKLTHFYPERTNGAPLQILGEYFPKTTYSKLTYQTIAGPDTQINVKLEADQDPYARYLRVYVNDVLKYQGVGSSHAWEWDLGDYTDGDIIELTVELYYGGYVEWGKKLSINRVTRLRASVEVDYMTGHAPPQADLDTLEAYYILLSYDRVEFHLDDEMTHVNIFEITDSNKDITQMYWDYYYAYRDHPYTDPKWEWVVFCHYFKYDGTETTALGSNWGWMGSFMHDQTLQDLEWLYQISALRRTVLLHEFGHHINIIDMYIDDFGEIREQYCFNWYCAMHEAGVNVFDNPWYCEHHWSIHRFPGW